jgi:hypothetical protein
MKALRALGYVWSAPYGLLGPLLVLIFRILTLLPWVRKKIGWITWWRWRDGALEVLFGGRFPGWLSRPRKIQDEERRWAGFTLGWAIMLWHPEAETILPHEHRHVDQCLVFGVLFPPAYGAGMLKGKGYWNNPFERDARRASGEEPK